MKSISSTSASLAMALAFACATVSAFAAPTSNQYGDSAPATAADRTIVITPHTRSVNVQGGETVTFDIGGKAFTWDFDGRDNVSSVPLNQVAPAGVLDHAVTAYVSPNPLYAG